MARGKRIPDEVRAQVMAALLAGQGVTKVSEEYKIPQASVSRIKTEIDKKKLDEVGLKKDRDLSELIVELVITNIETLTIQSEIVRDPKYVKAQSASELATLFGVIADKTIRILGALEATEVD